MIRTHVQRLVDGRTLALLVAALAAASMFFARPAHAETFTVDNAIDPGNGTCSAAAGCTLREAITAANAASGADTINFAIPGSGVRTISPVSELPQITEAVTIDGYSQPGSSPNTRQTGALDTNILVELNGSGAGTADGLTISASNVVARGLVINRFSGVGIVIDSGTGSRIEGNFIGTDPTGTLDRGNADEGVLVFESAGEGGKYAIGGTIPAARNLISGNDESGIRIFNASNNKIQGNLIGVQKDGSTLIGGPNNGVTILFSSGNTIGGAEPGAANTLAFNRGDGVVIATAAFDANGNRILGNSIFSNGELGIDLAGTVDDGRNQDARDPDRGPNTLQNFPEISSAEKAPSGTTTVKATLESTRSTARKKKGFTIQFFANPQNDSSGLDEGKTFLGQKRVTTNRKGKVSFAFQTGKPVAVGDRITATATGKGGTSEFSDPVVVDLAPGQG